MLCRSKETIRELAFQYKEYTDLRFNEEAFIKLASSKHYKELRHVFERVYARIQELEII